MRSRDRTILIAVLIVATMMAYGHLLAPGRMLYSPHSDIVAYHPGAKQVASDAV